MANYASVKRFVYELNADGKPEVTFEFVGIHGVFKEKELGVDNQGGADAIRSYIYEGRRWYAEDDKPAPNIEDLRIEDMSEADVNAFFRALDLKP